ncbi:PREDICTED: LOW QUALITY PROTEIN: putative golgin subfamily A member 8F/8G [Rhinopithecus bieti]|nr:PREDICTED: LOW QUALITY PROTEIN: putative golgin subfamily A member 8F/8G [Rhinopithecus bieti]
MDTSTSPSLQVPLSLCFGQVRTLKEERQHDMRQVEKLERRLSTLKNQMAEPLPPEPPAVTPEEELQHLRKELERVSAELQAQVENNQRVSLLNRGQKERLREQEERLQQLAEPQSDFEELNNENKSTLQLEQQIEELQEKLGEEHLEAASQQNQQLQDQLNLMALPGEGDGGGHLDSEEEGPRPMPSVPEDLESWEAMSGLMHLLEEKTDLRECVEKLQLQFIQYWRERCHQKIHHLINEPGGSAKDVALRGHHQTGPGQGGDESEAAGAAGDAVTACGDYNKGHSKLLASSQNRADEPDPGAPPPQELGAAHKHGDLREMSLTDSAEPAHREAKEGSPHNNPTAQPITQEHQEHPGLGSNRPVPFFCWAWLPRRRR